MFKTDKYKITFKREENIIELPFKNIKKDTAENFQLRTIVWCYITKLSEPVLDEVHGWADSAILHPNDKYDKVIGKKIALTKNLKRMNISKEERTVIWQAFWEMITSWELQSDIDKRTPRKRKIFNEN